MPEAITPSADVSSSAKGKKSDMVADAVFAHECELCPRTFTKELYLKLHRESHIGEQITPVQCYECEHQFLTQAKLEDHIYNMHFNFPEEEKVEYETQCCHCKEMFETKLLMIIHKLECTQKPPKVTEWSCTRCTKVFCAERFLRNHLMFCKQNSPRLQFEDENDLLKCDFDKCEKICATNIQFRNHLFTHKEYPFMCQESECTLGFTQKKNFLNHYRVVHATVARLFNCKACDEEFSSADQLESHRERFHDDEDEEDLCQDSIIRPFSSSSPRKWRHEASSCSCKFKDCKQKFGSVSELRCHYLRVHSQPNCALCRAKFKSEEDLSDHSLKVHSQQLQMYSCPLCDQHLSLETHLIEHLRKNHLKKPWKCPSCKRLLFSLRGVVKHKLRHSQKYCDICGKLVPNTGQLLSHAIKNHDVDACYSCPVQSCRRVSVTRTALVNHVTRDHFYEAKFRCEQCDFSCYNMLQLEDHLTSGHMSSSLQQFHSLSLETDIKCNSKFCNRAFSDITVLALHQIKAHGGIQFEELPVLTQEYDKIDQQLESSWPVTVNDPTLGTFSLDRKQLIEAYNRGLGLKVVLKPVSIGHVDSRDLKRLKKSSGKLTTLKVHQEELSHVVETSKAICDKEPSNKEDTSSLSIDSSPVKSEKMDSEQNRGTNLTQVFKNETKQTKEEENKKESLQKDGWLFEQSVKRNSESQLSQLNSILQSPLKQEEVIQSEAPVRRSRLSRRKRRPSRYKLDNENQPSYKRAKTTTPKLIMDSVEGPAAFRESEIELVRATALSVSSSFKSSPSSEDSEVDISLESVLDADVPITIKHVKSETEFFVYNPACSQDIPNPVKVSIDDLSYDDIAVLSDSASTSSSGSPGGSGNGPSSFSREVIQYELVDTEHGDAMSLEASNYDIAGGHHVGLACDVVNVETSEAGILSSPEWIPSGSTATTPLAGTVTEMAGMVAEVSESATVTEFKIPEVIKVVGGDVSLPEYDKVIKGNGCPQLGDFARAFDITTENILNLVVPSALRDQNDLVLGKGLAIDLHELSTKSQYPTSVLSRYLYELLPECQRPPPSCLSEENSIKLNSSLVRIKEQASRFRARYSQFPKYLNKLLLEKFNPFQAS